MNERELFQAIIEKHPSFIEEIRANERAKAIDELENMICCEPWFTNKQKDVIRAMAKELKEKGDN